MHRHLVRLIATLAVVATWYGIVAAANTLVYLPLVESSRPPAPTATRTPTMTPSPTVTLTAQPTETASPTATETEIPAATPTATATETPTTEPTATPTEELPGDCMTNAPAPVEGAQAWVTNEAPAQNSDETVCARLIVDGVPQNNIAVHLTVHYKSKDSLYDGVTASQGTAALMFGISRASVGFTVVIDVEFATGQRASTSFTPQ